MQAHFPLQVEASRLGFKTSSATDILELDPGDVILIY